MLSYDSTPMELIYKLECACSLTVNVPDGVQEQQQRSGLLGYL